MISFKKGDVVFGLILVGVLMATCKSKKGISQESIADSMAVQNTSTEPKSLVDELTGYVEKVPLTETTFEMVGVPAGSFMMGSEKSEPNRLDDEGPLHQVSLNAFYIGKYEVTWDLFELFYKKNRELFVTLDGEKRIQVDAISGPSPPYEDPSYGMGNDGYPAISMSTYSTLVFCKWLSAITGRFYRLPTEAEWEYAARAGSESAYAFGDSPENLEKYAVYSENSSDAYDKVGTKLPNSWGIFDMHGNVAEWTMDEYKPEAYAEHDENNPWVIPQVIHPRVFRGGSWLDAADKLRSAARGSSSMDLQRRDPQIPKSFWWFSDNDFIGFRLVSPKNQPSMEEQEKFWQLVLDEG